MVSSANRWPSRGRTLAFVGVLVVASLVAVALRAEVRQFTGRVVGVSDGDTILVLTDGRAVKVRLAGIDCPEKRQAFGARAKQFASEQAFGRDVTVIATGRDRYGRTIGEVLLPSGDSLNRELVRAGLAWWYRQYSNDEDLAKLEAAAREARRGLWADPHPVPPWEFRKATKGVR